MGYDTPDDVVGTLDRAEALVFEVAERRVSETMVGIHDALQETLDNLEARYGDDSELVGVPTGFTELDAKLHGLQRENLVIVAARARNGQDQPRARHGAQRGHVHRAVRSSSSRWRWARSSSPSGCSRWKRASKRRACGPRA